jgi:hypothetical protein
MINETGMSDDEFSFDVLEDPEMIEIGQRLIVQGSELLDDTDLSSGERKKVEKIFSDCWESLREMKGLRDAFLKMTQSYRKGPPSVEKKGVGPKEVYGAFVTCSMKILDQLMTILGPLTYGKIPWKSYLKHREDILKSLDHLEGIPQTRSQAVAQVIQEGESYWIEPLAEIYEKIKVNGNLEKVLNSKSGPLLQKGSPDIGFVLKDGKPVNEVMLRNWKSIVDFCEDFIAHAIQLRFLEIVEGLEVIPRHKQDPVYPRRFKVILKKASLESDETEA